MKPDVLEDKVHLALNRAARAVGKDTDAFRPLGPTAPLTPSNRFLRLRAALIPSDGGFSRPSGYGDVLWHGLFDAAYTRPGDYLVEDAAVWFIAAQQRLLPVLCVRTNRTVSFWRAAAPANTGMNSYGGVVTETNEILLQDWPASVLGGSGRGSPESELPSDSSVPYWTVLLPATAGVILRPADLMTDDLGRNSIVAAAELTDLGWRIAAKQVTT